ncbi:hypothetical protein V8E53_011126 [Lactarius tabidus]
MPLQRGYVPGAVPPQASSPGHSHVLRIQRGCDSERHLDYCNLFAVSVSTCHVSPSGSSLALSWGPPQGAAANGSCCCYNANKRSQAARIVNSLITSKGQARISIACESPSRSLPSITVEGNLIRAAHSSLMRRIRTPGHNQSAKTYLEQQFDLFADCNLDVLIHHGLHILPETLQPYNYPTTNKTAIALVGPGGCTRALGRPLTFELLRALRSRELQFLLPPPPAGTSRCHSRRQKKRGKIEAHGVTSRMYIKRGISPYYSIGSGDARNSETRPLRVSARMNLTYVNDLRVCRFGACVGFYGMDCDGKIYLDFRINIERRLALFKVYLRMPEPELHKNLALNELGKFIYFRLCMHVLSTSHFNRYRWIPALLKCAIQEVGVTARVTLDLGRPTASTPNGNCKLMSPTSRDRAVTLGSQRLQHLPCKPCTTVSGTCFKLVPLKNTTKAGPKSAISPLHRT